MRDTSRWAERERLELTQKKKKYHEGQDEMTKYMKKLEKDKRIGNKPSSKLTDFNDREESEDEIYSDESDITREARIQKRNLKKNFGGPAESFNNKRQQSKIELANKLMKEKEDKIEEAL
jgi:hypothetical protein